jgi:hypothetical protein
LFLIGGPGITVIMHLLRTLVLAAVVAAPLIGCAGMQRPDVERAAVDFATGDPDTRCTLLARSALSALEEKADSVCAEAVRALPASDGEVLHSEVWGDEAQVRLSDDTLFLTHTGAGWRVVAAGCTPNGEAPYECHLEAP